MVIIARSEVVGTRSRTLSVLPSGGAFEKRDFQKIVRHRKLGAVDLGILRGYLKKDSPGGSSSVVTAAIDDSSLLSVGKLLEIGGCHVVELPSHDGAQS